MNQSSILRRLETILEHAVDKGEPNKKAALVLSEAMGLDSSPGNILDFCEILNKAEEEARNLRDVPKIHRYFQAIDDLHQLFVYNHIWSSDWHIFANHIRSRGILIALDALANYLHSRNNKILLEEEFLDDLSRELESLLSTVLESDISKELKRYLIDRIEDILRAIRRYSIDGTEGLENAAKLFISDLALAEHTLKDEDKKKPAYQKVKAFVISLALYLVPTPYDIIGSAPDLCDFWVPKFEEFTQKREWTEKVVSEESNIQNICEIVSSSSGEEQRKILPGREPKALPPSKKDEESDIGHGDKSGS